MKGLQVGIVGGTRGMGLWMARLLAGEGHRVHAWGKASASQMERLIPGCQVIFVSVPLGVTQEVIQRVGPLVGPEAGLMDLSSLKAEPLKEMLSCSSSEVVGLHPLFGPRVRSLKGKGVVVCRGRGTKWFSWVRGLLQSQGARLVEMDPQEHDRAMAVVQVLTHLNTMSMGLVMKSRGIDHEELSRLGTPVFRKKMAMVRKVFHENPDLYCSIVALNPYSTEILEDYSRVLAALSPLVGARDPEGLKNLLTRITLQSP